MSDIEDFNKQLKESVKKTAEELPKLKKDLESKLSEFGSFELMANVAIQELFAQSPELHRTDDPVGENPLVVYLLGLFLQKNNIEKGEPHPNQALDILNSVTKYFDSFKWNMMPMDPDNRKDTDSLLVSSRLKKLFDDTNPHCYPDQKYELVRTIFSSIDDFLKTNYGFSVNDALDYEKK
ncbi:MAG: hypothetical protein KC444_07405 [Nitrosopumilus sp.]|nr:hypothetical protein [Nitrosopumilus sp.]